MWNCFQNWRSYVENFEVRLRCHRTRKERAKVFEACGKKKKPISSWKKPQSASRSHQISGYPDAPFKRVRRAPGHPDDPPLKSFSKHTLQSFSCRRKDYPELRHPDIRIYPDTVKLQIFVRYLFSYFRLETGSYVLIFVLSRVCEENDVEIQWLQSKNKFSYDINFRTFSKVRNVRK